MPPPISRRWPAGPAGAAATAGVVRRGARRGVAPAAAATGLAAGTPIVVGGADHVFAAYGAGLAEPGDWLIKLGSSGDILAVSDAPVLDERLYLDAIRAPGLLAAERLHGDQRIG